MAETGKWIEKSTGSEDKPERPSPFIRRVAPLVKRLGPFAAPFILTVAVACAQGAEKPSPLQVAQSPTSGPTAGQQIEKPPSIEATVVPTALPTVEPLKPSPPPSPPSETKPPAAAEKPPSPKGNWLVEVDPEVSGPSYLKRSPEQDVAIINQVLDKFPRVGNLKIILTKGMGANIEFPLDPKQPPVARIGRDVSLLEPETVGELSHYFDIELNEARLSPYYRQEDLANLREIRAEIVAKYRNYPQIEKMFNPQKYGNTPLGKATSYPDSWFIAQSVPRTFASGETRGYPLPAPLFAAFLKSPLLDKFAQEVKWQIDGVTYGQFSQNQQERLRQLASASPYWQLALEILEAKKEVLANWQWWNLAEASLLDSKYLGDYFLKVLPTYANMVLTEALAENDPRLERLLTAQQVRNLKVVYQVLEEQIDEELFATVYSHWLLGDLGTDKMVEAYHQLIGQAKNP